MVRYRIPRFGLLSLQFLVAVLLGLPSAHATVYNVSFPSLNISGTITTDGTTGVLSASNITNWDLTKPDAAPHYPTTLNDANSIHTYFGNALTANGTQLLFDFSDATASELSFVPSDFAVNGGIRLNFCDATAPCADQNNTNSFSVVQVVLVAPGCCATSGAIAESDLTVIGRGLRYRSFVGCWK